MPCLSTYTGLVTPKCGFPNFLDQKNEIPKFLKKSSRGKWVSGPGGGCGGRNPFRSGDRNLSTILGVTALLLKVVFFL